MAALTVVAVERAKPGATVCGDAYQVIERPERTLVAVVDGLGSGPAARSAAELALEAVTDHADEPLESILGHCHTALLETRGAAVGLLGVRPADRVAEFCGVGNIEVRTLPESAFRPLSTNGIVGANHRAPRVFSAPYRPGEVVLMYTDGLRSSFDLETELMRPHNSLVDLAERLADQHGRGSDDLTLVVVSLP